MSADADYNFAFLDEQTKRHLRRALLKAVAVPGYQVPFGSREMPLPYGWGTGGIQVTANSPALPLLVRKLGERALLLAVNPGAADIAAQFTIAGMTPTRVTRCFEDAVTPVTAARFTANVPALGRAVFTLE